MTILAILCVALATVAVPSSPRAVAQDSSSPGMKNLLVLSLSSYDQLRADAGFLGKLVGKPDLTESIDNYLDKFTQEQGLAGLDKGRPWGLVVRTDGAQFQPLAFVPVTDLKQLLGVLAMFQIEAEERNGGVFELQAETPAGAQSLFVRQSGDWAYVGQSAESLSELPAAPVEMLDGLHQKYDLAVRLHVQNIPALFRQMAVGQMQAGLQQGLDAQSDQQDEDAELRQKLADAQLKSLTRLIEETDHLTVGWLIGAKQQKTHLDFSLVAVEQSQLAKQAAELRDAKSAFAGFLSADSAASLNFSSTYPQEDIQQMLAMLGTVRQRAMQAIDEEVDLPGDTAREALKSSLGEVMDVLRATVESGTMDGGMLLDLGPGASTLAGGAHLVDAHRLETALKQMVELAENEPGFQGVQWDVDKHEGVRFHTTRIPVPEDQQFVRAIFGEVLDVAVGIGPSSYYVAVGRDGLGTLKAGIDRSKAAASQTVAPASFVLSLGKIMKFAASLDDNPMVSGLAEALDEAAGSDHVRITVTAIPRGFSYRLEVEEGVLQAIGQMLPMMGLATGAF